MLESRNLHEFISLDLKNNNKKLKFTITTTKIDDKINVTIEGSSNNLNVASLDIIAAIRTAPKYIKKDL